MGVAYQISNMIARAREERRAASARRMAEYAKASVCSLDAQPPEPLTQPVLNTVLLAIATQRPILWHHAWALVHRIKVLEAKLAKCCPNCECDPELPKPVEKVAGEPRTAES